MARSFVDLTALSACLGLAAAIGLACDAPTEPDAPAGPAPAPKRLVGDFELVDKGMAPLLVAGDTAPRAGAPLRDVIVIVLDTVRRDRLDLYGHPGTTPELTSWAQDARVFTQARSVASWTLPAHASLFTGRHPISHGAHSGSPESGRDFFALPKGTPTLAGRLSDAGYVSVGIAANRGFLSRRTGIGQGFDLWLCDQITTLGAYPAAERITDMAIRVLEKPRARPIFLFLNYLDAHTPMHVREDLLDHPERMQRERLPLTPLFEQTALALMAHGTPVPEGFFASWSEAYDAELRYLDRELGRLLRALPELGVDRDDLVVVLSDHGELFGEHDLVYHWRALYEELIAIPLVVRGPGFPPGRDPRPVQTQDLPAWILDFAEVDRLPGMQPTRELQVAELYWTRQRELRMPELRRRFDRVLRAFVHGERKLIVGDDGSRERYDLSVDPQEARPQPQDERFRKLESRARRWMQGRAVGKGEIVEPPEEMRRALEALGYVEPSEDAMGSDEAR